MMMNNKGGNAMVMMGYARVSSKEQNLGRQLEKFKRLGIEDRFIFTDKITGATFKRESYDTMKQIIREKDLIYFDSLDRLGRDYDGIIREWKYITRELKADIVILENETLFDSRKFKEMGDLGKLMEDQFLSLLSYVAEQERKKIRKRQRDGIDLAIKNGVVIGRPKVNLDTISEEQREILEETYPKWKKKELTAVKFMEKVNLKRSSFYKIIKEYEEKI